MLRNYLLKFCFSLLAMLLSRIERINFLPFEKVFPLFSMFFAD
jgi:hypothetical protein